MKQIVNQGRRSFTRVPYETVVLLYSGDGSGRGTLNNLSLDGMHVSTSLPLDVKDTIEADIQLPENPEMGIYLKGEVVRIDNTGVALSFQEVDVDSFTHLKKLVMLHSDDADQVQSEIGNLIDRKEQAR